MIADHGFRSKRTQYNGRPKPIGTPCHGPSGVKVAATWKVASNFLRPGNRLAYVLRGKRRSPSCTARKLRLASHSSRHHPASFAYSAPRPTSLEHACLARMLPHGNREGSGEPAKRCREMHDALLAAITRRSELAESLRQYVNLIRHTICEFDARGWDDAQRSPLTCHPGAQLRLIAHPDQSALSACSASHGRLSEELSARPGDLRQ